MAMNPPPRNRNPTNIAVAKRKLNELFINWMTLDDTQVTIDTIIKRAINPDKTPLSPRTTTQSSSPSSRPLAPPSPRQIREVDELEQRINGMLKESFGVSTSPPVSPRPPAPLSPSTSARSNDGSPRRDKSRNVSPEIQAAPPTSVESHLIPKFYFPKGKPPSKEQGDKEIKLINAFFKKKTGSKSQLRVIKEGWVTSAPDWITGCCSKICGFPKWWATRLFHKVATGPKREVTHPGFMGWWKENMAGRSKDERLFRFIQEDPNRGYINKTDFLPFMDDLLKVHPGLEFLKTHPEFQEKYGETVNVRIFYSVNRSGTGRIELPELRRSNLVPVIYSLDEEEDINLVLDYFSYEHFYVLYCKFWELDTDHDFLISKADLSKYNNYALTNRIIDRIFSGVPRALVGGEKMNYEDFAWFCLSEEDKSSSTACEYWFRAIDIDRDGIISGYELDYFFEEQQERMATAMEDQMIMFSDILCQMIDMLSLENPKEIRLTDLKSCPTASAFFNVLFNFKKFLAFESRDPFVAVAERSKPEKTDWDRFARAEYDLMALEADGQEDLDGEPY